MTTPVSLSYDRILQAVRGWPPVKRLTLAREILEDVAMELPEAPLHDRVSDEMESGKDTLSHALGLLASPTGEPPSDAVVASWLEERRQTKYSQ